MLTYNTILYLGHYLKFMLYSFKFMNLIDVNHSLP